LIKKSKAMNTQEIKIDLPSDILLTLNESESELKKNIKISLAIRLYSLQKLTIGKAAQISGLSRYEFENVLAENNLSISNLTVEDVLNDSQKLK
jgi:predicted HTH domain antitoxin